MKLAPVRCPACGRRLFDAHLTGGGTRIEIVCPRRECGRVIRVKDTGEIRVAAERPTLASLT